jgi:hypothetical protein
MSSEQPSQTLADYVALAFSPALIMGLVGSLVFFLLEVAYGGEYEGRLRWILFFFVFGAVLAGRLAIAGHALAGVYGSVLGLLTWLGMQSFFEYPPGSPAAEFHGLINLGLVATVWWCAQRLTWDCTHIDEETDVGGEGLLEAAGIEPSTAARDPKENKEETNASTGLVGWIQRYQRYREERQKKRTLGVWVVYFSLAALPLFGLGQSLIPVGEGARRRYAFWLMTVYVGCGLGLLLTTCFLGLRRYLRQRKLQMPAAMTGAWMSAGAVLVVVLLVLGAFLPRPEAEYPLFDFGGRAGTEKRAASKYALKGDSPGKDKGRPGSEGPRDPKAEAQAGQNPGKGGQGDGNQDEGKDGSGQGKKGSGQGKDKSGQGQDKSGQGQDKSGQGEDNQGQDNQGQGGADKNGPERQDPGKGQPPEKAGERANADQQNKDGQGGRQGKEAGQGNKGQEAKGESGSQSGNRSESGSSSSGLREAVRGLAGVLKWVVFAVVAIVVVVVLLRSVLQFLANFTNWAQSLLDFFRNFWANLFGGPRRTKTSAEGAEEAGPEATPEMPFSAFSNPFADGRAGRLSPRELIRYTFAAVQAWARERGLGRQPGETPLEFVQRVSGEVPTLEDELRRLVMLFGRAEYSRGGLPANAADAVRAFWDRLEVVVEQPMSA